MLWPEIREVKDPPLSAHAFTENGRTVIEVDEKLKGRERSKAILAAWREHERGLAALVAMPVLAYLWDPFKRWAAQHPLAAMAVGITYGGALVLAVTTVIEQDRPVVAPQPATESPWTTVMSPSYIWSPTRTQHVKPTRTPHAPPMATEHRPAPAPRPTRDRQRPASTHRPPTKRPTPKGAASAPEHRPSEAPGPSVTTNATDRPAPEPAASPRPPDGIASPQPTTSPSRDCVLEVDVDPLLHVCAL